MASDRLWEYCARVAGLHPAGFSQRVEARGRPHSPFTKAAAMARQSGVCGTHPSAQQLREYSAAHRRPVPLNDVYFADAADEFASSLFTSHELDAEPFLREYLNEVLARWGRWATRGRPPHLCFEAGTIAGAALLRSRNLKPSERTERIERALAMAVAGATVDELEPDAPSAMREKAVLLLTDEYLASSATPQIASDARRRSNYRRSKTVTANNRKVIPSNSNPSNPSQSYRTANPSIPGQKSVNSSSSSSSGITRQPRGRSAGSKQENSYRPSIDSDGGATFVTRRPSAEYEGNTGSSNGRSYVGVTSAPVTGNPSRRPSHEYESSGNSKHVVHRPASPGLLQPNPVYGVQRSLVYDEVGKVSAPQSSQYPAINLRRPSYDGPIYSSATSSGNNFRRGLSSSSNGRSVSHSRLRTYSEKSPMLERTVSSSGNMSRRKVSVDAGDMYVEQREALLGYDPVSDRRAGHQNDVYRTKSAGGVAMQPSLSGQGQTQGAWQSMSSSGRFQGGLGPPGAAGGQTSQTGSAARSFSLKKK
ncbi:hypothetical protein HDU83_004339 [Entophlyctis luteolus]|nr:hypothetical protein HDU83_004339 [Entophlyctis luteolus]